MKTTNRFINYLLQTKVIALTLLFSVAAFSCDDEDDVSSPATPTNNIVELAQSNPDLSSLEAALIKFPDLITTLSGNGNFTVFAPSNAAFTSFLAAIGQTSLDNIPESVLEKVLEYHVVTTAALRSTQFTAGNVNTAASENIAVTVSPNLRLNSTVAVTTANVEATNGIVHVIDAVLVPPTILPIVGTVVAPAYFNKDFSVLTAAVVRAGLVGTLTNTASQYTVFAPTNAAFISYLGAANEAAALTTVGTLTVTALADILTFHVLGTEVKASAITTGSVTTIRAANNRAFVTKTGSAVTINNARVTTADIEASNGVVHVIDAVLTPPVGDIVAVATSPTNAPLFNILVASLTKTGLVPTVQGTGPLTVFAPTDDAFLVLLRDPAFFGPSLDEAGALNFINNTITETSTPLNLPTLTSILTYHVVSGSAYSINLTNNQVLTTLKAAPSNTLTVGVGSSITIDGSGSTPSTVTPANISATNGVVHVIDKVLLF